MRCLNAVINCYLTAGAAVSSSEATLNMISGLVLTASNLMLSLKLGGLRVNSSKMVFLPISKPTSKRHAGIKLLELSHGVVICPSSNASKSGLSF